MNWNQYTSFRNLPVYFEILFSSTYIQQSYIVNMRKVVRFVIFCLGFSLFHCESQYINKKLWKDNYCTLWRCQVCKVSSPCSYAENYTFLRILIFLNFRNSPMFFTYCKDHRKRGLFFNSNWTHLQLIYFAILPTTLKSTKIHVWTDKPQNGSCMELIC